MVPETINTSIGRRFITLWKHLYRDVLYLYIVLELQGVLCLWLLFVGVFDIAGGDGVCECGGDVLFVECGEL